MKGDVLISQILRGNIRGKPEVGGGETNARFVCYLTVRSMNIFTFDELTHILQNISL